MVEGDRIIRSEMFDEADLDAALARFDELSRPVPRLENAASRVLRPLPGLLRGPRLGRRWPRCWPTTFATTIAVRWLAPGSDRSRRRDCEYAGHRRRRDHEYVVDRHRDSWRAPHPQPCQLFGRRTGPEAFRAELLGLRRDRRRRADRGTRLFDPDDIDAAFEELDARYLAGEAAAHAHTWSVIAQAFAAFNRHELPAVRRRTG